MNSKNLIIGILALTTIVGGIFAWRQYQRANTLADEVARLAKAAAERSQRRSPAERAQTDAGQPPSDTASPEGGNAWQGRMGNMRAVLDSPEAAKLMASQQRGMLDARYAGLFKSLNLTPGQLEKFKDMLLEKQNAARDVMSVAREQGLDFRNNRDEIRQLVQQTNSDIDANIIDAIGQDKFAQYQAYDQTQTQRAVATQLEQRLSYTADPLTESQSSQLVALLAANSTASADSGPRTFVAAYAGPPGGGPPMMIGGGALGGVQITDQVINSAQSFLSASQVSALRQMQSEQNDQRQLQQLIMSSGDNSGGDNNSGGQPRRTRGPRN